MEIKSQISFEMNKEKNFARDTTGARFPLSKTLK